MKQIKLGKSNKFVLIDDIDFEYLNQWKWHLSTSAGNKPFYAVRKDYSRSKKQIYMHNVIMRTKSIDHADGNGLNNQRYNLRKCSNQENSFNQKIRSTNTSGYKGVSWHKDHKKWVARITINYKRIMLGDFINKKQAAKAYDTAAKKYFGEFARVNFQ